MSSEEAKEAGEKYQDVLSVVLASLRIGTSFGTGAPMSGWTKQGLALMQEEIGVPCLNDRYGVIVFESESSPVFFSNHGEFISFIQCDDLEKLCKQVSSQKLQLSDRHRLALELFHSSFFQPFFDTRFLTLVMAIEALLEPLPRSEKARNHVNELIKLTKEAKSLSKQEKNSLLGSLKWLLDESINHKGKKLASDWLGDKVYMEKTPDAFFGHCYKIRSDLVHGRKNNLSDSNLSNTITPLIHFVSDLLSSMLIR